MLPAGPRQVADRRVPWLGARLRPWPPSLWLPRSLLRSLLPWLLPLALLLLWQAGVEAGWITRRTLPAPLAVLRAAFDLTVSGELPRNAWISCQRALAGFAIGGAFGLALGVLNGLSATASRLTDTTLQMLRNIPHLAIIPMVILWFGIGEGAKLFLVALGTFPPIYLNTFHGVRMVEPGLIEMARMYRLSRAALFWRVVLPGTMPSILLGVRYALGIMWLTLIVAETISANSGIGYMTMNAREFLQTDVVLVGILVYALLGKLADLMAKGMERLCLAWHPNFAAAGEH
jgi:sulfonate transport system permease protein